MQVLLSPRLAASEGRDALCLIAAFLSLPKTTKHMFFLNMIIVINKLIKYNAVFKKSPKLASLWLD